MATGIYHEIEQEFLDLQASQNNSQFNDLLNENIQGWRNLSVEIKNLKREMKNLKCEMAEQNEKFQQKLDTHQQKLDEFSQQTSILVEVATMVEDLEKGGRDDAKIAALIVKISQNLASSASTDAVRTENVAPNEASFSFGAVTTTISTFFSSVFAKAETLLELLPKNADLGVETNSNRSQPRTKENATNTVTLILPGEHLIY